MSEQWFEQRDARYGCEVYARAVLGRDDIHVWNVGVSLRGSYDRADLLIRFTKLDLLRRAWSVDPQKVALVVTEAIRFRLYGSRR